jgi:membrane protein implicated in regulation of membrane protease activity
MRTFATYLVWQLPSWVVGASVVAALTWLVDLPLWAAALILALFIVKDLVLFPAMRVTFSRSAHSPWPIGERGQATKPLEPSGYVRVNGELWRAEAQPPGARIPARQHVVVRSARGLTLLVEEDRRAP